VKSLACYVALLGLFFGRESTAQQTTPDPRANTLTLSGVVKDISGNAVSGAQISVGRDLAAFSDSIGNFSLAGVPRGTIDLVVRRMGFQANAVSLETKPDVTGVTIAVTMVPNAVSLGTIVIEGKTLDRDLWMKGFYKRQDMGRGYFFTPQQMAHTKISLSTLMTEVPSVALMTLRGNSRVPVARVGGGVGGPRYCAMNVFLDGQYLSWATQVGIDNVIAQQEVKAIEVYNRPSQVPNAISGIAGFGSGGVAISNPGFAAGGLGECGVILLWSKPIVEEEKKKN
jgi:hypothetical protein